MNSTPARDAAVIALEPYGVAFLDAVAALSLRAWAPVFESIAAVLGPELYREQYPDWRSSQRSAVISACQAEDAPAWVAVIAGQAVGFMALKFHRSERMGEVHMLAVEPTFQRRGVARALLARGEAIFAAAGMLSVMIETGGDPGHSPARRLYEARDTRRSPAYATSGRSVRARRRRDPASLHQNPRVCRGRSRPRESCRFPHHGCSRWVRAPLSSRRPAPG